jgi:hypothetical protein
MRWIVVLAILAAVAFALGWWYVRDTGQSTEIIIDKEEVKGDTEEAVEQGKELLQDTREGIEELASEETSQALQEPGPKGESAGTPVKTPEKEPAPASATQ